MQFKKLLSLAFAGSATAQSLLSALASQNGSLSVLNSLLQSQPALVAALGNATNITVLAPSNDALNALLNSSSVVAAAAADPGLIPAILSYHILNGTYYASNFTNTSSFPRTYLTNTSYVNLSGGQRVQAMSNNGTVSFYSALKEMSNVTTANVNFTGGTIHIINKVLSIPQNDTATFIGANLTAVTGALTQANLASNISSLRNVTIFAPNNDAFNNIGSLASNISASMLANILGYHVVSGTVAYSSRITNGSMLQTLDNSNVTITVVNSTIYVNSARVILADLLVNNGVVHVLDNVLNPSNSTARPNPTASTNEPAFSGATTASSVVPFTSGVATPTSTAPAATGARSSSSSGFAAPKQTAAVGVAALFGGAAMLANF